MSPLGLRAAGREVSQRGEKFAFHSSRAFHVPRIAGSLFLASDMLANSFKWKTLLVHVPIIHREYTNGLPLVVNVHTVVRPPVLHPLTSLQRVTSLHRVTSTQLPCGIFSTA